MEISDAMFRSDYWRCRMYAEIKAHPAVIQAVGIGVEFGGSNGMIQGMMPNVSFETRYYPEFDVLDPKSWEQDWDVIVMDQVLEHVKRPWEVFSFLSKHTRQMAIITLPFLALIHPCPDDYWRLTPNAIREMAGTEWDNVDVYSWGNRLAVEWLAQYEFNMDAMHANVPEQLLRMALQIDESQLPVMVWAVMTKGGWHAEQS